MSKTRVNFFFGISSLFTGFLLYVLFRETTYIAKPFAHIPFLKSIRTFCSALDIAIVKYYLPDFLWAFSLSCFMVAFCTHSFQGVIAVCCIAAVCGIVWELLQWTGILPGTGDILDIITYLTGSSVCFLINLKERKT